MTDPDSPTDPLEDAPIDAEFEEAPEPERPRRPLRFWFLIAALGAAVVLIALTGPWALRSLESAPQTEAAETEAVGTDAPQPSAEPVQQADAVPESLRPEEPPQGGVSMDEDAQADLPSEAGLDAARAEIETLRAELAQLRDEIAAVPAREETPAAQAAAETDSALAARVAALEMSAPNIVRNEDRLDQIEERLAELSDMIDQLPNRRDFAALEARIADMESRAARSPAEAAWRFAALREAASRGAPFEAERAALARLRPDDPDLAAMQDSAVTGVPSLEELRRAFPAEDIRAAAVAEAPEETGRFAWLRRWVNGLVRVRRAGAAAGETEQAVAAAEAALADGDLLAAIEAARELGGAAAETASYWLGRAEARARLDARIDAVQESLAREAGQ